METSKEESKDSSTDMFEQGFDIGWNSALELAAFHVESKFTKAFGQDTLASISIYLRNLKK